MIRTVHRWSKYTSYSEYTAYFEGILVLRVLAKYCGHTKYLKYSRCLIYGTKHGLRVKSKYWNRVDVKIHPLLPSLLGEITRKNLLRGEGEEHKSGESTAQVVLST